MILHGGEASPPAGWKPDVHNSNSAALVVLTPDIKDLHPPRVGIRGFHPAQNDSQYNVTMKGFDLLLSQSWSFISAAFQLLVIFK